MSDPKSHVPAAQEAEARRAAQIKSDAPPAAPPQSGRTTDTGMKSIPNAEIAPSGALDAEGQRPVLERSRKVR